MPLKMLIWAFPGEKDEVVSEERSRGMIAATRQAGDGKVHRIQRGGLRHLGLGGQGA